MKRQKTQNTNKILKEKNKATDLTKPNFNPFYKATVIWEI